MIKNNTFQEKRKQHDINLIANGQIFNNDKGKRLYLFKNKTNSNGIWLKKADFLMHSQNNLFPQITNELTLYFALNHITFHHLEGDPDAGFCLPSGHTLSSQIACLNHLYPLRYDKQAVLAIAKQIHPDIVEVFPIETDKFLTGYISFEVTSDVDHLNETKNKQKLNRGSMCTSLDALIYGKLKDNNKIIIPIEWKYTESYQGHPKTDKDCSVKDNRKEKERLRRYTDLIRNSQQLAIKLEDYRSSVYFFEPFYQLMRQTLLAEQLIANSTTETIKATTFVHAHIVPKENKELLDYEYAVSKKGMVASWEESINDKSKYRCMEPQYLFANLDKIKYQALLAYLSARYWEAGV